MRICTVLSVVLLCVGCSQEMQEQFATSLSQAAADYYSQKLIPQESSKPATSDPDDHASDLINDRSKQIAAAITPTNQQVRFLATKLAQTYPGPYNIAQVCAIWYQIKSKWRYTNDPRGQEYFASAEETFWTVGGDCDDFAIFIASLIEAIGGATRIVLAYNTTSGHAYCEVFLAKTEVEAKALCQAIVQLAGPGQYSFHYHKAKEGCWLNLDWSAQYPGGPFFEASQEFFVYPDGHWHR